MKNLKVSVKLILSFSLVIVLTVALTGMGLGGMKRIKKASDDMYTYNVIAADAIGLIRENFANQRYITRELIIYDSASGEYQDVKKALKERESEMEEYMELYSRTMLTEEDSILFERFQDAYYDDYTPFKAGFIELTDENETDTAMERIRTAGVFIVDNISRILQEAHTYNASAAKEALNHNTSLYAAIERIETAILVVALVIVVLVIFRLQSLISKPLNNISTGLDYMSSTGDLALSEASRQISAEDSARKDEIGMASRAIVNLLNHISDIERAMSLISNGEFDVPVKTLSDRDTIGISVTKVAANLKQMFQSLKNAEEEAQTASKAKGTFLAHISHEIRTPLNAIMGMAAIAKKADGERTKTLECIEKILVSSRHLLSILNNVLDMSKIESGKLELTSEPFRLRDAVAEVCGIISQSCADKGIDFTTNIEQIDTMALIGDKMRLNQVLVNLLGNAVRFTGRSGKIKLSVEPVKEDDKEVCLLFTVTDSGIGMTDDQMSKLFKPFEQTDSSIAAKYGGTGLGLSISWNIVTMMGGVITVESEQGAGSTFRFDLCFEKAAKAAQNTPEDRKSGDLKGKRLLLAEDIEINRIILIELLKDTGVIIEQAENGKQAALLFEQSETGFFDIIVMDVQMPVMDGYEATRAIRSLKRADAKTTPIIAMTANAYKEDVERCMEAGMNGHIAKPVEYDTLMEKLLSYVAGNNYAPGNPPPDNPAAISASSDMTVIE